ncbi:hypothetical protein NIES4073_30480 [Kalymmatonema gypsitolerans NIES-4073]|nr:hypothetical protein NIES4073_30480 [Scytonema sp. NIES-4073]
MGWVSPPVPYLGRAGCPTPVAYGGKPSCSAGSPTRWIIYFLEISYLEMEWARLVTQLREAEPQVMHSQPQAGNEAISQSLFYSGFYLKLTLMSRCPPHKNCLECKCKKSTGDCPRGSGKANRTEYPLLTGDR